MPPLRKAGRVQSVSVVQCAAVRCVGLATGLGGYGEEGVQQGCALEQARPWDDRGPRPTLLAGLGWTGTHADGEGMLTHTGRDHSVATCESC